VTAKRQAVRPIKDVQPPDPPISSFIATARESAEKFLQSAMAALANHHWEDAAIFTELASDSLRLASDVEATPHPTPSSTPGEW
jgi:hypothetical protein